MKLTIDLALKYRLLVALDPKVRRTSGMLRVVQRLRAELGLQIAAYVDRILEEAKTG